MSLHAAKKREIKGKQKLARLTLCDFGHDLVVCDKFLKILKYSYNPRLKSVVFDCWFDMFTIEPYQGALWLEAAGLTVKRPADLREL